MLFYRSPVTGLVRPVRMIDEHDQVYLFGDWFHSVSSYFVVCPD